MRFNHVFVAGTFDGLHQGHEALLKRAFGEGERVTIGLTSDDFVRKYKVAQFALKGYANFAKRAAGLRDWLAKNGLTEKAAIIPIDDPYEPAASDKNFEALVVTAENKHRGEEINRMRQARGLPSLQLMETPLVPAQDGGPISSTRVRSGDIDQAGRLVMPENLRTALGEPLGPVLTAGEIVKSLERHQKHLIVTVGDVATKTVISAGRQPALSIVDFKVSRKPYHDLDNFIQNSGADIKRLVSGPGFIAAEATSALEGWGREVTQGVVKQRILVVDGEEDLLTLPAIAYSPLGGVVYYGQPPLRPTSSASLQTTRDYAGQAGQGLVEVEVTEEKKKEVIELLDKFT